MKNYKNGFINVLVALAIGAIAVISGALLQKYPHQQVNTIENKSEIVGAVPTFTSGKVYTLYGGGISSTDTSIKLSSFLQPVSGQPILTADLIQGVGASFYITIEPSTNRKETVGCNVVTQNIDGTATLSGCTRGYMFTFPYTTSTTLQLSHSGGSRVVLSDSPQLYNDIISYVNTITAAGVVDSSSIAKGIVEMATGAEAAANAAVGSGNTTAPLALGSNIASSTRKANIAQVVVASTTGYIDYGYIATSTTNGSGDLFKNLTLIGNTTISNLVDGRFMMLSSATTTSTALATVPLTLATSTNDYRIIVEIPSQSTTGNTLLTFNGDGGASYAYNYHQGIAAYTAVSGGTSILISNEAIAAVVQYIIIDVKGGGTPLHTVHAQTIFMDNGTTAPVTFDSYGVWDPGGTTAITSLNIAPSAGTVASGTRISVYSLK